MVAIQPPLPTKPRSRGNFAPSASFYLTMRPSFFLSPVLLLQSSTRPYFTSDIFQFYIYTTCTFKHLHQHLNYYQHCTCCHYYFNLTTMASNNNSNSKFSNLKIFFASFFPSRHFVSFPSHHHTLLHSLCPPPLHPPSPFSYTQHSLFFTNLICYSLFTQIYLLCLFNMSKYAHLPFQIFPLYIFPPLFFPLPICFYPLFPTTTTTTLFLQCLTNPFIYLMNEILPLIPFILTYVCVYCHTLFDYNSLIQYQTLIILTNWISTQILTFLFQLQIATMKTITLMIQEI